MALTIQLPLILDIIPDGNSIWPSTLLLLKMKGESRRDTALIALKIHGECLREIWWWKCQRDNPTISLYEMLQDTQNEKVYIFEVSVPTEAAIKARSLFGTTKAQLLYYPRENSDDTIHRKKTQVITR